MKITDISAHPISFRVPEGQNVTLGIGRAVKRDAGLTGESSNQLFRVLEEWQHHLASVDSESLRCDHDEFAP